MNGCYEYEDYIKNFEKGIKLCNKKYGFLVNIISKDKNTINDTIIKIQDCLYKNFSPRKYKSIENDDTSRNSKLYYELEELHEDYCLKYINDCRELVEDKNRIMVLNIDPVDGLYEDDESNWRKRERINNIIRGLLKNNVIIICSPDKYLINTFFRCDRKDYLKLITHFNIFDDERHEDKDTVNELFSLYDKNKINYTISYDELLCVCMSDISNIYINSSDKVTYLYNYSISKYLEKGVIDKSVFDDLIDIDNDNNIDKEYEKVTSNKNYVGLDNVKNELNTLFNYASYIKKLNINKNDTYLNMLFLGNPGTGKTMIADIVADKLYELGYLEKNDVVRIVPNDLIGEYVGQTRDTAREVFNKAKGKLLFIDEAYLICQDGYKSGKNPFMEEAVVELLKYLEDPKNIVIFAGYKDEVRKLYDYNPGFKSRIYKEIIFEDYSNEELIKILSNDLKEKGLKIDTKAKNKIKNYLKERKQEKNFGNARTMKKISQELIMNHANRLIVNDDNVIDIEDVLGLDLSDNKTKRMGFDQYDRR